MTDSMVERVDRVIRDRVAKLGGIEGIGDPDYIEFARAVIAVLREPTKDMVKFGDNVRGNHADYKGGNGTDNVFRAMIDVALERVVVLNTDWIDEALK